MKNKKSNLGTIFITGISASGKTTLGKRLLNDLIESGFKNLKLLDGEETRTLFETRGLHFGYSVEDRDAHTREIAKLVFEYNAKGIICIVCAIAPSKKSREEMRQQVGSLMEVYLECPVEVCAKRDYKGHYSKAFKGLYKTFIGVTDPYEISDHPQLVLKTHKMDVKLCSETLLKKSLDYLKNGKNEYMMFNAEGKLDT